MTLLHAAGWFALGVASAAAQTAPQKGGESPEIEYLRRLIAEQQKNPDKVIRSLPTVEAPVTPSAATNRAAPESAKTAAPKTATPVRARENTNAIPTPDEPARQKKFPKWRRGSMKCSGKRKPARKPPLPTPRLRRTTSPPRR